MSEPLRAWTPEEQAQHRQELADALDNIAWDPDWPALGPDLVPPTVPENRPELTVLGGWRLLTSQREWLRRQAWDERISESAVLRRILADHLAARNNAPTLKGGHRP
jgi:hypothetical protein